MNASTACWVSRSRESLPQVETRSVDRALGADPAGSAGARRTGGRDEQADQPRSAVRSRRQPRQAIGRGAWSGWATCQRSAVRSRRGCHDRVPFSGGCEVGSGPARSQPRGDGVGGQPAVEAAVEAAALGVRSRRGRSRASREDAYSAVTNSIVGRVLASVVSCAPAGEQVVDQPVDLGGVVAGHGRRIRRRLPRHRRGQPARSARPLVRSAGPDRGPVPAPRSASGAGRPGPVGVAVAVEVVDLQRAAGGVDPDPAELARATAGWSRPCRPRRWRT